MKERCCETTTTTTTLTSGMDFECTFIVSCPCADTISPDVCALSLWGSNQIINHLCVLSTCSRFRHGQENQVSTSAIGADGLSSHCLMKYSASKATTFSIRGETATQGNETKVSLIMSSPPMLATLCCIQYGVFCIVRTKETHFGYKMFNLSKARRKQF